MKFIKPSHPFITPRLIVFVLGILFAIMVDNLVRSILGRVSYVALTDHSWVTLPWFVWVAGIIIILLWVK